MKSMREQITSMGESLVNDIGSTAIKIAEQSRGVCLGILFYEPTVPIELLEENIDE